jgi:hypothetical protein
MMNMMWMSASLVASATALVTAASAEASSCPASSDRECSSRYSGALIVLLLNRFLPAPA